MIILTTNTLKTFDHKVNKIKSLPKKQYYLRKTLKKIDDEMELTLGSLHLQRIEYIKMLSKHRMARAPGILARIRYNLRISLPEQKNFRFHVLTLIAETVIAELVVERLRNNPKPEQ